MMDFTSAKTDHFMTKQVSSSIKMVSTKLGASTMKILESTSDQMTLTTRWRITMMSSVETVIHMDLSRSSS